MLVVNDNLRKRTVKHNDEDGTKVCDHPAGGEYGCPSGVHIAAHGEAGPASWYQVGQPLPGKPPPAH